jgi:hypothetical protein
MRYYTNAILFKCDIYEDLVSMYKLTIRFRHQTPASLGGDIGCGNGKYINVRKDVFILGCDRSFELIKIVQERGYEVKKVFKY